MLEGRVSEDHECQCPNRWSCEMDGVGDTNGERECDGGDTDR